MNAFMKTMRDKHILASRIEHLRKNIEHCVSVVALCRIGGQAKAEASYEARLKQLNEELLELRKQQEEVP